MDDCVLPPLLHYIFSKQALPTAFPASLPAFSPCWHNVGLRPHGIYAILKHVIHPDIATVTQKPSRPGLTQEGSTMLVAAGAATKEDAQTSKHSPQLAFLPPHAHGQRAHCLEPCSSVPLVGEWR
mmetsp:Transcript_45513/g.72652  ORF Transcript_45513/g.72652 Transcript_45513/m.72652 type:complete len:125 (-) Transcript_45513:1326-1700(-)